VYKEVKEEDNEEEEEEELARIEEV